MGCGGSKNEYGSAGGPDEQTIMFLCRVNLLKRLPPDELPALAAKCDKVNFTTGQTIINQGDEGNEFFMIQKGSADVEVDGKKVASLKGGDYFGENALLRNEPRTATIKAVTDVKALKITRKTFTGLGLDQKLDFTRRDAVAGGVTKAAIKPPTPKNDAELKLISDSLKNNANLNTIVTLDDNKIAEISEVMWKESISAGTAIITQGDMQADYFYVVQSGSFDITKKEGAKEGQSVENAVAAPLGAVESGASFGELALLYMAPRAATITAKVDSECWVTARHQFKDILARANEAETAEQKQYIQRCDVFSSLKESEQAELASTMRQMNFKKDEHIFDQGESGTQFFLLVQGSASVQIDGKEVARLDSTPEKAPYFGEKALLENAPRAATIIITSDTAMCLWIDRETFELLLGSLSELMTRGKDGDAKVGKTQVAPAAGDANRYGKIQFKDIKRLGLLGCGGFGAVEMVEIAGSDDCYALKALSKGYVVKSGMEKSVMSEKTVQMMCDSEFVVRLYETYNIDAHLYLLLELALGGELYATYNKKNLWGKEPLAKFYVAGTLFAFDHLHSKKIIFRDLKPENLLLTDKGRVKLTDMGLAKVVLNKTYTTCGTPDYFAPELIASKGHTDAVDWWTLGVLTFELMSGHPPFESASPMQIYSKVKKGINAVKFPKNLQGDAEEVVKGLCTSNPNDRLPVKKGGSENVKCLGWFKDFDWKKMEDHTMTPPYVPVVKNKKDKANFTARKEDMPPQLPYKDPGNGWDKDFATSS